MAKKNNKQTKEKHVFWIWGSTSEVERLPSTQEALGSIPSTAKQNNPSYFPGLNHVQNTKLLSQKKHWNEPTTSTEGRVLLWYIHGEC